MIRPYKILQEVLDEIDAKTVGSLAGAAGKALLLKQACKKRYPNNVHDQDKCFTFRSRWNRYPGSKEELNTMRPVNKAYEQRKKQQQQRKK